MRVRFCAILILLGTGAPLAATAEESAAAEEAVQRPEPTEPPFDLERLLRVPRATRAAPELRGGKDRKAWEADFTRARQEVAGLEESLTTKQQQLREAAPQNWGFSPTGAGAPSDPEVLRLRSEIRRDRQSLEAAHQRLRELEVEASLAGVPPEWTRHASEPETAED
jgi:hypothetical protein